MSQMEPLLHSLEPVVNDLSAWHPGVDATVGRLQADLGDIRAQLTKIALGADAVGKAPGPSSSMTVDAPSLDPGAGGVGHGQFGHGTATAPRALPFGGPLLQAPVPTNGTFRTPFPTIPIPNLNEQGNTSGFSGGRSGSSRVECPEFDGDNPTGWKICCEACFRIGAVDPSVWVDTAVINFTGAAALWLEWSQAHIKSTSWDQFVASVLDKFGRSEFQHLLCKFPRLKQQGSVLEYAEQFNVAMHSLLAHHSSWDPLFFTTHFMDGLHHDIKVAVMLHRPKDLETAVALAELQEEVIDMVRQDQEAAFNTKGQSPRTGKFMARPPMPVAMPFPSVISKGAPASPGAGAMDGRRNPDNARIPIASSSVDDKLRTLRAYRKARGLCFTCGERWGPGHVCSATVPLHVVQELVGMLTPPISPETTAPSQEGSEDDLCLLSTTAANGTESPKAFRMLGTLNGKSLLMLVDSGSSHSFINFAITKDWPTVQPMARPLRLQVADGAVTMCETEVPVCEYEIQGHQFKSNLKLFPLGCYDHFGNGLA